MVEHHVLPSDHPCLTGVHKDGSGLSQVPPTTVSPPQLWSCGVVQATNYKKTKYSSRWVVHVSYPEYRIRRHMSSIRTLQYLSFLCTGGKWWRVPLIVMLGMKMADDIIYRGLSPVGNLKNHKPAWGRYHYFSRMINDPTSPVGREPMTHISHPEAYYSWTRILVNCVASTLWLLDYWCSQLRTLMLEWSWRSE